MRRMYQVELGVHVAWALGVLALLATGHAQPAVVMILLLLAVDAFNFVLFAVLGWWIAWPARLRPPFREWINGLRGRAPDQGLPDDAH
jgi:hypothetical protein